MSDQSVVQLQLKQLHIEGGTQPRVAIDEQVVTDYAEALREGASFPPVVAFFDGVVYWLADGFHRYHAHRRAERPTIEVEVHEGVLREAILYAVGANNEHGLRRTNADKRKAVLTLLTDTKVNYDDDGQPWSDSAIAKRCLVDPKTVSKIRSTLEIQSAPIRKTTDGRTMNTSNIGRSKRSSRGIKLPKISPTASMPVRQPRPALAQTHLNLPHDPDHGARAIVAAMGHDYGRQLIVALNRYLQSTKEGEA